MVWIKTADRLSDMYVSVLTYIPSEEPFPMVREGYLFEDMRWHIPALSENFDLSEVKSWADMPEPPIE